MTIHAFRARGPQPPPTLTRDERAEWDLMVRDLTSVGTLAHTDRAALTRYVRRAVQLEARHAAARAVDRLSGQLRRLARRLDGDDRRTVEAAAGRLTELELAHAAAWCRGWDRQRAFLSAHRLSQLSRRDEG